MIKKKLRLPLQIKLVIVLAVSLVLASLVFYGVYEFGNFLVWRYYLGETDKLERADDYAEEFQAYVTENKLSVDDKSAISQWNPGPYADMIVYKDQNLIYAPEWFQTLTDTESGSEDDSENSSKVESESGDDVSESETVESSESETLSEGSDGVSDETTSDGELTTDKDFYEGLFSGDRSFEQYLTEEARKKYGDALSEALNGNNALHPIYFVDGTLLITIVDFTEEAMGNVVFAVSIISALSVIAIVLIVYFSTVARRLRLLAENVRRIEEGDMEYRISESGNDEISSLASDVNSMRDAIVENMTKEKRAWEANAGLITAMSHDIRTPLTVMLGYLDLIEMQNSDDTAGEYIESCRDNALRLKKLSDDMFSYFLAFGKGENNMEICAVSATEWLSHVLLEQEVLLSERGFKVSRISDMPSVEMMIDESYFRRVTDNLFSNIIKYADSERPVSISVTAEGNRLLLVCSNGVCHGGDKPESNGIGLKTCVKIIEEMGGELYTREDEESFTVCIAVPCKEL